MSLNPTALVIATVLSSLPAQTTHLVGPGGFTEIRDALAIAASGDALVVLPGTYAHFEVNAGITIRAAIAGSVAVRFDPAFVPASCTSPACLQRHQATWIDPGPGKTVQLTGLYFVGNTAVTNNHLYAHRVIILSGNITIDQCTIESSVSSTMAALDCNLHIQDSTVTNLSNVRWASALFGSNAQVTAINSAFTGSGQQNNLGADAIWLERGSTFRGSYITAQGGALLTGLRADDSCTVWLSDSTLSGGWGGCPMSASGANGRFDRCVLNNFSFTPCSMLLQGYVLGAHRPQPPARGTPFRVDYKTTPNSLVGLVASFELAPQATPIVEQPWLAPFSTSIVIGAVAANTAGLAVASVPIPAALPVANLPIWIHGITGMSLPLQAAPAVGGVIR